MTKLSQRVRHTRNGDGAIVLDIENGKMFSTNATGALLCELLSSDMDERKIIEEFAHRLEITHEVAEADLNHFRETLRQHSLLAASSREVK